MLSSPAQGEPKSESLVSLIATKKKKSKGKRKSKKSAQVSSASTSKTTAIPVLKFPTSKTEASTNWKLLLSQKSAQVSHRKNRKDKPVLFIKDQKLRREQQKHSMDEQQDDGSDKSTKEIHHNLPDSAEKVKLDKSTPDDQNTTKEKNKEQPIKPPDDKQPIKPIPPLKGLNVLQCFDYTHYGHLRTLVLEEHKYLTEKTPALAIDCEMVGVGPLKEDALARVSIVNEFSYCLYDKFVKPKAAVTDYRTEFSGVREEDLKTAAEFKTVMLEVSEIIKGHVLVGHSLKSDFDVLFLKHAKAKIRDTAFYYRKKYKKVRTPSLKGLVKDFLKVEIQKGEHNSITDAQAAMKMYLFSREEWEESLSQKYNLRPHRYWLAKEYRVAVQALGWSVKRK